MLHNCIFILGVGLNENYQYITSMEFLKISRGRKLPKQQFSQICCINTVLDHVEQQEDKEDEAEETENVSCLKMETETDEDCFVVFVLIQNKCLNLFDSEKNCLFKASTACSQWYNFDFPIDSSRCSSPQTTIQEITATERKLTDIGWYIISMTFCFLWKKFAIAETTSLVKRWL